MSPTGYRRDAARRFTRHLGIDPEALFRASMAVWSNLNPQSVTFEQALSVAGVALRAAAETPASGNGGMTGDCRCHGC